MGECSADNSWKFPMRCSIRDVFSQASRGSLDLGYSRLIWGKPASWASSWGPSRSPHVSDLRAGLGLHAPSAGEGGLCSVFSGVFLGPAGCLGNLCSASDLNPIVLLREDLAAVFNGMAWSGALRAAWGTPAELSPRLQA